MPDIKDHIIEAEDALELDHLVQTHRAAQERRDRGFRSWDRSLVIQLPPREAPFSEMRDRFAAALHASRWYAEHTDELHGLWDEIKDAEDVEHFDDVLSNIYDAADLLRCRIQLRHEVPDTDPSRS